MAPEFFPCWGAQGLTAFSELISIFNENHCRPRDV
ncbi:MAG: hypothetical protein RLZZ142_2418 [Verrucomicrobiota bacterium]|jgi:hypothetical protein